MRKINKKKVLIVSIVILSIIIIIILNILNKIKTENKEEIFKSNNTINTTDNEDIIDNRTEDEKNQELISKLKRADESERIRTYLGIYFKYIENKNYEDAYELLYNDFKQNYFPSLNDYKKYIEKCNYPELLSIDYKSISMQGDYYIVVVKIGDLLSKSNTIDNEVKFVIKENNYNDVYISFQM